MPARLGAVSNRGYAPSIGRGSVRLTQAIDADIVVPAHVEASQVTCAARSNVRTLSDRIRLMKGLIALETLHLFRLWSSFHC
jgi:hypothetical protein